MNIAEFVKTPVHTARYAVFTAYFKDSGRCSDIVLITAILVTEHYSVRLCERYFLDSRQEILFARLFVGHTNYLKHRDSHSARAVNPHRTYHCTSFQDFCCRLFRIVHRPQPNCSPFRCICFRGRLYLLKLLLKF